MEEGITRRMAIRLQTLWQELKIPQPDRAYIVAVYLEGSMNRVEDKGADTGGVGENKLRGEKVHRELVRQIRLLLKYRTATIKVEGLLVLVSIATDNVIPCFPAGT